MATRLDAFLKHRTHEFCLAMRALDLKRQYHLTLQYFAHQARELLSQTQAYAEFTTGYPGVTRRHALELLDLADVQFQDAPMNINAPFNNNLLTLENSYTAGMNIESLRPIFRALKAQFEKALPSLTAHEKVEYQSRLNVLGRSLFPPKQESNTTSTFEAMLGLAVVVGLVYWFGFKGRPS